MSSQWANNSNYQHTVALDVIQVIDGKKSFSKVISVPCMHSYALRVQVDGWLQCLAYREHN